MTKSADEATTSVNKAERCGIVMPISSIDGCDEAHWLNVREILTDAIKEAGYDAVLVSAADETGVIHKRIVQNLYENPIVVCDVSGKNANVMLELGMRLAFDKPVIIVKDDKTTYSFDTSPIDHLTYPRDLRYQTIVSFKESLAKKIIATIAASKSGDHTTFLGHFGKFKVVSLETEVVSTDPFVLEQLQEIRDEMRSIRRRPYTPPERDPASVAADLAERALREVVTEGKMVRIEDVVDTLIPILRRRYPTLDGVLRKEIAVQGAREAMARIESAPS